jgi:AbrB family looped-hinge helix DNA binding protein
MLQRTARLTTKGQVTIPIDVRRLLGVQAHDEVTFVVEDDQVRLTPASSVVDRTAGMLKGEPLRASPREEKLAAEEAIAEEAETLG